MEKKKPWQGIPTLLIFLGVCTVIGTVIMQLGGVWLMLKFVITSQTQLSYDSTTWRQWKNIPIPIYLKARFFNITNPYDFSKGAKPILQEVGPYVYRERLYKEDIIVHEANDTIKYRPYRDYFFEPELSNGTENDIITMINIPFVAVAKLANEFTDIDYILNTLDSMLAEKGERLTRNETVHDILWGFSVKTYVDLANSDLVRATSDVKLPERLANGKMGILQGKNSSDEGWFEVRSGKNSYADFGKIVKYNDMDSMPNWKGPSCNAINGTDGIIFPPFMHQAKLYVLVPDMCRSIPFQLTEMVDHYGVPTMRFRQPKSMYETPKTNPDNWCFCPSNDSSKCDVDGLLNVEPCLEGAPIYASQPHFLFVDEKVRNLVIGLNPDPKEHWGYMDLYPLLGLALEARHRIQFNLKVKNSMSMPTFSHVKDLYLPVLWIEEGGTLDGINKFLVQLLVFLLNCWSWGQWVSLVIGGIVFPGIAYHIAKSRKKKEPAQIYKNLQFKLRSTSTPASTSASTVVLT